MFEYSSREFINSLFKTSYGVLHYVHMQQVVSENVLKYEIELNLLTVYMYLLY